MIGYYGNDVILTPLSQDAGDVSKYTFKVAKNASKVQIYKAFEIIFGKKAVKVNTVVVKPRASVFKRVPGTKKGYKKAVIRLEKGETLDGVM